MDQLFIIFSNPTGKIFHSVKAEGEAVSWKRELTASSLRKKGATMKKQKNARTLICTCLALSLLFLVSACNNSNTTQSTNESTKQQEANNNKKNVQGLVKVIDDPNVRYKLDNAPAVVYGAVDTDGSEVYGFDDPDGVGTSIVEYGLQKKLNSQQVKALFNLFENSVQERESKETEGETYQADMSSLWLTTDEVDDFTTDPNGAIPQYVTLSNVETKFNESGKYADQWTIEADVTVHFKTQDGKQLTDEFQGRATPDTGDDPILERDKERVSDANIMNKELPADLAE